MHISHFSALLVAPALATAFAIPTPEPSATQALITAAPEAPVATPAPAAATILSAEEGQPQLELRQATGQALSAATTAATQAGTVTTNYIESVIGSSTTWVEVIYTQTFASVPEQWATAGSGTIGLGTITGEVGVVKDEKSGGSVLAPGTLFTGSLAALGVAVGMGAMLL